MPIFEVQGPDGKTYEVDAPDMNAAAGAFSQPTAPDERDSVLGKVDAAMRGAADVLSFGMADELAAGLGTGFGYLGDYDAELIRQRGIDQSDNENRFGYRLGGQLAGGVAGGAGMAAAGLSPAANAIRGGAGLGKVAALSGAEGAVLGAAQGFGSGEGLEDRAGKAATGFGVGLGLGAATPVAVSTLSNALRSAVTPFASNPERQRLVAALAREGVDVSAGQRTGSRALRFAEGELGGNTAQDLMERQGEQFTGAALRRAGVSANRATPEVIDKAFDTIGQTFDDLAARNTMRADATLARDLGNTVVGYESLVPESMRAPIVRDVVADLHKAVTANGGTLPGDAYQALRSRVERAARGAARDPQLADALRGIKDAVDDAMERSISPADAGAWQEVRRQYRNMIVLEKAATGAGENAALGIISPSQLRNSTVVAQGRRNYARGGGDFAELARAGEAVLKPLPDSGTAPRLKAQNLGSILTALGAGTGGVASGGNPYAAIMGGLVGAAVPKAAGAALMSGPGQAYFGNQAFTQISPEVRALVNALINANQSAAVAR